jgi:hypothetical protein
MDEGRIVILKPMSHPIPSHRIAYHSVTNANVFMMNKVEKHQNSIVIIVQCVSGNGWFRRSWVRSSDVVERPGYDMKQTSHSTFRISYAK